MPSALGGGGRVRLPGSLSPVVIVHSSPSMCLRRPGPPRCGSVRLPGLCLRLSPSFELSPTMGGCCLNWYWWSSQLPVPFFPSVSLRLSPNSWWLCPPLSLFVSLDLLCSIAGSVRLCLRNFCGCVHLFGPLSLFLSFYLSPSMVALSFALFAFVCLIALVWQDWGVVSILL